MARVTVEDCIEIVPNRFDLVMVAARRARELSSGGTLTVPRDNDKNPVVALREIAEKTVEPSILQESLIKSMQRIHFSEDNDLDADDETSQDDAFSSSFVQAYEDTAMPLSAEDDDDFDDDDSSDEDDAEVITDEDAEI